MNNQLTLTRYPGLSARHRDLRDCLAAGVYQRGLTRMAQLTEQLETVMQAAGMSMQGPAWRGRR